jgi:hypothetical protein
MKYLSKVVMILIMVLSLYLLYGCQSDDDAFEEIKDFNQGLEEVLDEAVYGVKRVNLATDQLEDDVDHELNDFKSFNTATVIFNGSNVDIDNPVLDTEIFMDQGNLVVNSTRKMTLVVSGSLNGSIRINKPDGKLKLVLDGITIESASGPGINLQTEKRVFLVINDQTVNNISDGSEHPLMENGSKTKAAIFSEEQLIISGNGN